MRIYYKNNGGLFIESNFGIVNVFYSDNRGLVIENEEILSKMGLTVNDALAMYFDRTKSETAKKLYPEYRERLRNIR